MVYFWFSHFIDLVFIQYLLTLFYDSEVYQTTISTEKSFMNGNFRLLDDQLIVSSHDSYDSIFFSRKEEIISTKPSLEADNFALFLFKIICFQISTWET